MNRVTCKCLQVEIAALPKNVEPFVPMFADIALRTAAREKNMGHFRTVCLRASVWYCWPGVAAANKATVQANAAKDREFLVHLCQFKKDGAVA